MCVCIHIYEYTVLLPVPQIQAKQTGALPCGPPHLPAEAASSRWRAVAWHHQGHNRNEKKATVATNIGIVNGK